MSTLLLASVFPKANATDIREPDGIHGRIKASAPSFSPDRDCPLLVREGSSVYCARTKCVSEALAAAANDIVWITGEWVRRDGEELEIFEIDSVYPGDVDPADPSSKRLFQQSTCVVPAS